MTQYLSRGTVWEVDEGRCTLVRRPDGGHDHALDFAVCDPQYGEVYEFVRMRRITRSSEVIDGGAEIRVVWPPAIIFWLEDGRILICPEAREVPTLAEPATSPDQEPRSPQEGEWDRGRDEVRAVAAQPSA